MPATITIELKNLRFFANHGWYEEEAMLNQEFEVQFSACFPAKMAIRSLEDTVDYAKVHEVIKNTFSEREQLLETVAQKIVANMEAAFPQLQNIQLTITKLNPLIPSFTGTVGITYGDALR